VLVFLAETRGGKLAILAAAGGRDARTRRGCEMLYSYRHFDRQTPAGDNITDGGLTFLSLSSAKLQQRDTSHAAWDFGLRVLMQLI
jgi:hypothetical protein